MVNKTVERLWDAAIKSRLKFHASLVTHYPVGSIIQFSRSGSKHERCVTGHSQNQIIVCDPKTKSEYPIYWNQTFLRIDNV